MRRNNTGTLVLDGSRLPHKGKVISEGVARRANWPFLIFSSHSPSSNCICNSWSPYARSFCSGSSTISVADGVDVESESAIELTSEAEDVADIVLEERKERNSTTLEYD